MAERSLSYFMRDNAKKQEVVEIPGLDTIRDENGEVVPFKVRLLSKREIDDIYDMYRNKTLLLDNKKKPVIRNGRAVYDEKTDANRALRRIIAEALVYPNLKDKELMDFFDCPDYSDMPNKVFPTYREYSYVEKVVLTALGIFDEEDEQVDDVEQAKN